MATLNIKVITTWNNNLYEAYAHRFKETYNWQKINSITYKHVFSKFIKHTFSHFHLKLFIIEIKLNSKKEFANYEWVLSEDIVNKPSSVLMKKIQGEVFC